MQIAALAAPSGDWEKVYIWGDLADSQTALAGSNLTYVVPAGKRLHVNEINCRVMQAYSGVLNSRPFSLLVTARHFSTELGRTATETLVRTPSRSNQLTFRDLNGYAVSANNFFDGGTILQLYLIREDANVTGFALNYACVVSGFMEDV